MAVSGRSRYYGSAQSPLAASVPELPASARGLLLGFHAHQLFAARQNETMNERPNMFAQNDAPSAVHSRAELPDDQIRALAPSVFAMRAMQGVSSRYAFVPTAHLVARLREADWAPVSAVEQRIKIEDGRGFQKHLIRFQRRDVVPVQGEYTAAVQCCGVVSSNNLEMPRAPATANKSP